MADQRSRDIRKESHRISHRHGDDTGRYRGCNQNAHEDPRGDNAPGTNIPNILLLGPASEKARQGIGRIKTVFRRHWGTLPEVAPPTGTPLSRSKSGGILVSLGPVLATLRPTAADAWLFWVANAAARRRGRGADVMIQQHAAER